MYYKYIANNFKYSYAYVASTLKKHNTVDPPNKGHFGDVAFVLYWEAVLWWEVRITSYSKHHSDFNRCHSLCPLHGGCPLVGGSFTGVFTVHVLLYYAKKICIVRA